MARVLTTTLRSPLGAWPAGTDLADLPESLAQEVRQLGVYAEVDERPDPAPAAPSLDPGALTVKALEAALADISDAGDLEAIAAAESAGKARRTALEAIAERLAEVGG